MRKTKATLVESNEKLRHELDNTVEALRLLTRQAHDRETLAISNGESIVVMNMPKGHDSDILTVTQYARKVLATHDA